MNLTPEELKYNNHPKMQEFYKEKMGQWKWFDLYYDPDDEIFAVLPGQLLDFNNNKFSHLMRIPDVYSRDSKRPERGLIGMLIGEWQCISNCHCDDGPFSIAGEDEDGEIYLFHAETLRLALLKAIAFQIGVEV